MELLKVADGLNAAIVLYHSHGVHSWMPPALSLRGYKDTTSIRGAGLDMGSKEPHLPWFKEAIAL